VLRLTGAGACSLPARVRGVLAVPPASRPAWRAEAPSGSAAERPGRGPAGGGALRRTAERLQPGIEVTGRPDKFLYGDRPSAPSKGDPAEARRAAEAAAAEPGNQPVAVAALGSKRRGGAQRRLQRALESLTLLRAKAPHGMIPVGGSLRLFTGLGGQGRKTG
jgi:hypothetical protein